jgi:peptide/nickel transport system substrate-binding protein
MSTKAFGGRGLAVTLALTIGVVACGSDSGGSNSSKAADQPEQGGTLNMLGVGDVDFMDPNISYYSMGYLALRTWSRQPYSYPADAKQSTTAVPDLATALPKMSADGLSATWTIRDGAQWDTDPPRQVTAEDAIRGIKITCNPAQPFSGTPDFSSLFEGFSDFCAGFADVKPEPAAIADYMNSHDVSGLKVGADDRTIELTLARPAAYLAGLLTLTAFSPRPREYDAYLPGSAELAQHTISDGPYAITAYAPTKRIELNRNPAWKGEVDPIRKAYVDTIVIDETVSQESTQQQLETGSATADMEFDNFPPPSVLPGLIAAKDPNLNLGRTSASNPYLVFNLKSPNNSGALADIAVRQALSYAINRANVLQALGGPAINPALTHVLPSSIVGGEQDFDLYPYDPDRARDMLDSTGVGQGLTLKLIYTDSSESLTKAFEVIQQDLEKVGVKVSSLGVPNADFFTKYLLVPDVASRGVWDVALTGWGADWYGNSALSFLKPLFSGEPSFPPNGANFGFYENPVTSDLIDQAIAATDDQMARDLWHKADEQTMKDAAIYPITQPLQPNYHAKQVHNAIYVPMIQNFDPTNVWLDKAINGG